MYYFCLFVCWINVTITWILVHLWKYSVVDFRIINIKTANKIHVFWASLHNTELCNFGTGRSLIGFIEQKQEKSKQINLKKKERITIVTCCTEIKKNEKIPLSLLTKIASIDKNQNTRFWEIHLRKRSSLHTLWRELGKSSLYSR